MNDFEQDYVYADEYSSQAQVFCMKCARQVAGTTYLELPKHNAPLQKVSVLAMKKFSNYRLAPVLGHYGSRATIVHLILCEDCDKFELTDEVKPKILGQIMRAEVMQVRWAGYPAEAAEAVREKWAATVLDRRLFGDEAKRTYLQEDH